MMPTSPFQAADGTTFNFIQIKNDDPVYLGKVRANLRELDALPLGRQLLTEINARGKNIFIVPTSSPASGNMCTSGGDTIFYRLRDAFRGAAKTTAERCGSE